MTGQQREVAVTLSIVGVFYAAFLVAAFRFAAARTPTGVVHRLYRSGGSVTFAVNPLNALAWDPSRPLGQGGFAVLGRVTYSLEDPRTIRVVFRPKSGAPVERVGTIPASLLPDSPATRRRRWIARIVIAAYLSLGITAFAVTASLADGTRTFRIRTGAVVALGVIGGAWLVTHLILTARRRRAHPSPAGGGVRLSHHVLGWIAGYVVVSAALGVAWRLSNLDQPHPMSWASSFLSAAVFVLAGGAAVAASLHHHTYVHHPHEPHGE